MTAKQEMHFKMSVVPSGPGHDEFVDTIYMNKAIVSPKADLRTKAGRRQHAIVRDLWSALVDMSFAWPDRQSPRHGTAEGHADPDGSGFLTITLFFDPVTEVRIAGQLVSLADDRE
jgi:hypothetical protein